MLKKILFILHMPPPVHGAAMMGKYIHDSKLINETFECKYINLTLAKDLNDIGKSGLNKLNVFIQLLKNIRHTVKEFKPDLCYVTPNARGGAFYKDFMVIQLLKSLNCKIIVHYHNKGVTTRQNKLIDNLLYKQFFKNIKVILLAEALYLDIKKYVSRESVYICPNGIPQNINIVKQNTKNPVPHLLFLSNLLIDKGVLTLLDACKIIKEKGYSFVCIFVGGETTEINSEKFNEELLIRGLKNDVKYLGKKFGLEKEECFNNSDIFILPTYNECFPLVLLEAMQHQLPCIATKEGGIPDIIEDGKTGFLINKKNPEILAGKLITLLNDKALCKQLGKNGREKYLKKFTLNSFEQTLKDILIKNLSCDK